MANRLSKIYTRTGDDGTTGLGDGTRVAKDSLRVDAMGDVDELNSVIGLMLTETVPDILVGTLTQIQHDLFNLGGEICIPDYVILSQAPSLVHPHRPSRQRVSYLLPRACHRLSPWSRHRQCGCKFCLTC